MATEVIMPRLGEGVIEGLIAKWLKQEGETVGQYEPLLEIETDKVTTEATAETAGTVLRILVPEGATVAVGTVLAYLGQPGEALPGDLATPAGAPPTAAPAPAARTHTNGGHTALPEVPAGQASRQAFPTRVSPVVARMAAEHAIDLSQIDGTGRGGASPRTTSWPIWKTAPWPRRRWLRRLWSGHRQRRPGWPQRHPPPLRPAPATSFPTATCAGPLPNTW